jgi:hypothetical protein
VYRWLAEQRTSIDVPNFFRRVAGNQAVVLKGNKVPVALAQNVTTPEDTPTAITLAASDPEGDLLTFSVVTQPTHGTLSGVAPNLVYTPAPNFNGQDSFTFRVDDGMVASRAARVDITVSTNSVSITVSPVNDAPVATSQAVTTNLGAPGAITLVASDVDGDILTFIVVTPPSHGTLSGTPPQLTYTPLPAFLGLDSFAFVARDPSGAQSNVATVSIMVQAISTNTFRPGFNSDTLQPNDDGSTGPVGIGFLANFFGRNYNALYINNNGNLTFDAPMGSFTPFSFTTTGRVIIAPFFADVDTSRGVGQVVTYGTGTVNGRPAFGINWPGVACFGGNSDLRNDFQVVLIARSDLLAGSFDIEFNYNRIQWETGTASFGNAVCQGGSSARVGFSNGTAATGTFFELPGSGVPGSFLDFNAVTGLIHHSLNTPERGRYVFPVR